MELKDISVGSLLVICGNKLAVVTGITVGRAAPLTVKTSAVLKTYRCKLELVDAVVGTVNIAAFEAEINKVAVAEVKSPYAEDFLPDNLKALALMPGDKIVVKQGRRSMLAVFKGYDFNRPKYPVSYEIDGRGWNGAYEVVVSKG